MRKVLINSKIEAIAEEYTDKLLKVQTINTQDLSTVNLDKIRKKLTDLSLKLVTRKRSKYRKYVENIIKKLPEIIKLKPSEFDDFKNRYFSNSPSGVYTTDKALHGASVDAIVGTTITGISV